jgi:UDP-3-O-[3-hydroxymyristoyl] glucosamine N-acyltransferase
VPEAVREPRIDPSALCESGWVGSGTRIGPGAYVGACAEIGRDCHIGEGASVSSATVGDGVTLEPGVQVLGPVTIGARARVCAGLTVMQDVAPGAVFDGFRVR